ncbi:MAG: cold shock domain-containing protein [Paracoccaceae bacterium]
MNCQIGNFEKHIQVVGHVKWFDPSRGYGFVEADETIEDILLHKSILQDFGQSSVISGSRVELLAIQTDQGLQARKIVSIKASEVVENSSAQPALDKASENEFVPARVKWFDKLKGYGFVNLLDEADDFFIHREALRLAGFEDVDIGEAILVQVSKVAQDNTVVGAMSWMGRPIELRDAI